MGTMQDYERKFWTDFCKVQQKLKEFYIKSEEYSKDFSTILQPIKEQKDALEHIVRVYWEIISGEREGEDKQKYIDDNFSKAMGHIYRAYYDTADIFTIILREKISDYLSLFNCKQILGEWKEYEEERKYLIKVNDTIAQMRIKKDVLKKDNMFDDYGQIIDHLLKIYEKVLLDVYPRLATKYL